jgi:ABC-type molybdate transport system substrate-binding protein
MSLAGPAGAQAQAPVAVYAAGSLRAALTELGVAFEKTQGTPVKLTFGASGLLKDRLAGGEAADVFASANMDHPQALLQAGRAQRVQPFARNAMCALATPAFSLQGKPLAQRLLDADVKLGISTPKADPAGDYAWQLFERIEATGAGAPGSAEALKKRALQLTGGPASPPPPVGRNVYGVLVAQAQADVFITYCTNGAVARREEPTLQVLPVPEAYNVSALYGMALMGSRPAAAAFIDFVLSPAGQAVLASHGFGKP